MGLDMYLTGEAFYTHDHPNKQAKPFPIQETHYRLAYWRKHPNLHGYIVNTFAGGVDNCEPIFRWCPRSVDTTAFSAGIVQKSPRKSGLVNAPGTPPIFLGKEKLEQIIAAIEAESLPHTEGFFFGASELTPEEKAEDLKRFRDALAWLQDEQPGVWKSVFYRASW